MEGGDSSEGGRDRGERVGEGAGIEMRGWGGRR